VFKLGMITVIGILCSRLACNIKSPLQSGPTPVGIAG